MTGNLYTSEQVKNFDHVAIDQYGFTGLELMTTAGERGFSQLIDHYSDVEPLVVLCGSGNNGGDGYVLANAALAQGLDVTVIATSDPKTPDATQVCQNYRDNGGKISHKGIDAIHNAGLIVDCLFGTGLNRAPAGRYAELICAANQSSAPVVALDIPSGLNGDSGQAYNPCIKASLTITYIGQKLGLYVGQGKFYRGKVVLEGLDLPDRLLNQTTPVARLVQSPPKTLVKLERKWDSHKGDYGNVIIAGGDEGMLGAPLLAGRAALRCGSGLVTLLSTKKHMDMAALHRAELMSQCIENVNRTQAIIERCNVIVLGPGLGYSAWSKKIFDALIQQDKLMVVDADGLSLLSQTRIKRDNWVLTPHPGEAARLLATTTGDVQNDRFGAVKAICETYGGVCVLKGAGTLIADQTGIVMLCDGGNPGMATAGMGDVLSGIVGSLMGQGFSPIEAAEAGVWLHSECADQVSNEIGQLSLLAGDVINALSGVLTTASKSRVSP